jgi:hypothetical protein
MNAVRICLLASVRDARQFLDEHPLEGWSLYALHPSVVDYLEPRGVPCADISEEHGNEAARRAMLELCPGGPLHARARDILSGLDALVPEDFQACLGLFRPVRLFTAMHGYMLAHGLWGRAQFATLVRRLLRRLGPREVAVYDAGTLGRYFTPREVLEEVLSELGIPLRLLSPHGPYENTRLADTLFSPLPGEDRPPDSGPAPAPRPPRRRPGRTLLLLLPEYELAPLLTADLPFELLLWPHNRLPNVEGIALEPLAERARSMAVRLAGVLDRTRIEGLPPTFVDRLRRDMEDHGPLRLTGLGLLETLRRQDRVQAVAWGNAAGVHAASALYCHYAMGCGLPVAGMQHGANNGIQELGFFPALGEGKFCTHLLGFGHAREDHPDWLLARMPTRIVPIGSTRLPDRKCVEQYRPTPGRVLFPITNSLSVLKSSRSAPAYLARAQRAVLEALEARTDLDVWIKPFDGSTSENFACVERLSRLSHARVARHAFTQALEVLRPSLVVSEYPSSPLYECLPYDLDIFCLLDPVLPFTDQARELLERRVHLFATVEELTAALAEYGRGPWPRRRDPGFYERFLHRPEAKTALVRWFGRLLEAGDLPDRPSPQPGLATPAEQGAA